jgi:hypothetical protein
MQSFRAISTAGLMCIMAGAGHAEQPTAILQAGSYEVEVRMEIPNVDIWSWKSTTRVCLPYEGASNTPFPVLSANNPFTRCSARNMEQSGAHLGYDIMCEGRGAARAHATDTILPDGFTGRIAMVLGAKNMTMREVQVGRRRGSCDLAAAP